MSTPPAPGAPLRISRVRSRVFPGASPTNTDPDLRVFVTDLARPYGAAVYDDLLDKGVGHSYGEMATPLLAEAVADGEPVDLLLLAFAIPDVRPARATALYLTTLCPGTPQAFAVCDQGRAAPFTALRLAGTYTRAGHCRRAVLLVVEQSALHHGPPGSAHGPGAAPGPVPEQHTAVAIVCDPRGRTGPVRVRQHPNLTPHAAEELLAAEIAHHTAGPGAPILVLGAGLSGTDLDARTRSRTIRAPAGAPYTGPWSALAEGLEDWARAGSPVLLAEYDHALGYLCLAALDPAPAHTPPPAPAQAP